MAPYDHYGDLRDEMVKNLEASGLLVERAHHEVGTAGQAEINYRFDTLLKAADDVMKFKYLIKNTAWEAGKSVTFMPKPIFGDNGSGMHVHQSLWKDGEPLFYDETGYGGLSDMARWYIGGILKHAPSLLAFTNPTVNSYHRLVPGFEAPISLVYSSRNRSASVRIPITGSNPKAKRIETRFPDPSANPYLAFSALMLAGVDGIKNKIEPPAPIDKDIYELPPDEMAEIDQVPTSLDAVLDALEADHDFLTVGNVFTPDLIETWIDYKRDERDRARAAAPAPARVRALLRHHVVQPAPVGAVDQRRDHQRDQDLASEGEVQRDRPRVAVLAYDAEPGRHLAERAAHERGEDRRLQDEDAEHVETGLLVAGPLVDAAEREDHHEGRGEPVHYQRQDAAGPRRGLHGNTFSGSRWRPAYALWARVNTAETIAIRSRNCPCIRCAGPQ